MKRRDFFSALTGLSVGLPIVLAETPTNGTRLRVAQPFQGAVLHPRLKDAVIDGKIKVSGEAPPDAAVTVNGIACRRKGNAFEAEIELRQKVNEIVVKSQSPSGEVQEAAVTVLWLKNSVPRYRFTIDDTLFFLREIHRSGYKSLFEDEFLGNLRRLHRKYGMKVALNLFYETSGDKEYLTVEREHFDLSQFSDKYKSQWRDNTDWLRLAFHAKREHPGEPYKNASAETLIGDFVEIEREIKRFAGEETYLPATVIHFGTVRPETYKPLATHGVTALSGYFTRRPGGEYYVNYQMDGPRSDYLNKHDFLLDVDSGIVFSKIDLVANLVPLKEIVPTLEEVIADPNTAEFIDLLTHEQYFWPFYKNHLPDHWDRLDSAFAFLTERGYKPVFMNDPPLGVGEG